MTYNIQISKARVIDEVQKTTEYIGSKAMSDQDPNAYTRIGAVDADREQLDRYWMEACTSLTTSLGRWLADADSQRLSHHYEAGRDYRVTLSMPSNWNNAMSDAVQESMASYLVNQILSKWCILARSDAAETHAIQAAANLEDIQRKLNRRVKPSRIN